MQDPRKGANCVASTCMAQAILSPESAKPKYEFPEP